jgi:catechol 2,3-dioxygenase-like lactoylglutathione lyase family enzyme
LHLVLCARETSIADGKPLLRGIHHLALATDDMKMTLDFYVRMLGMPIVHGLRTPSRLPGAGQAHGIGAPPFANIPHYFLDMGGDTVGGGGDRECGRRSASTA